VGVRGRGGRGKREGWEGKGAKRGSVSDGERGGGGGGRYEEGMKEE